MLKACLNGARRRTEHPRCPITPAELAVDGEATVSAGAMALHVHPRDQDGRETLDGSHISATLEAMRTRITVPIGVSTGAWFLPDLSDRLRAIRSWKTLPDFASVNFHEDGVRQLAESLLDRGVGVEAGLWTPHAADVLIDSELADRCLRIMLEPMEQELEAALANITEIQRRLEGVAAAVPRLLHGYERTAWSVLRSAVADGYDIRIGLEDTLTNPDGRPTRDNAELIRYASSIVSTSD